MDPSLNQEGDRLHKIAAALKVRRKRASYARMLARIRAL
jgi:hypothetical protein